MEIGNVHNVNPVQSQEKVEATQPVKNQGIDSQRIDNKQTSNQQVSDASFVAKKKKGDNLGEAVDKLNKAAAIFDRSLKFQIHKKTHQVVVSVIDTKTNKVIRQIPSKEALDIVSKMDDYMGLIFDKKA